jgi:hypothetical protein
MSKYDDDDGVGHRTWKDPSGNRASNRQTPGGPSAVSSSRDITSGSGLDETDEAELYPSDPEISESDYEDPQIQGIDPLILSIFEWREDSAWINFILI